MPFGGLGPAWLLPSSSANADVSNSIHTVEPAGIPIDAPESDCQPIDLARREAGRTIHPGRIVPYVFTRTVPLWRAQIGHGFRSYAGRMVGKESVETGSAR